MSANALIAVVSFSGLSRKISRKKFQKNYLMREGGGRVYRLWISEGI